MLKYEPAQYSTLKNEPQVHFSTGSFFNVTPALMAISTTRGNTVGNPPGEGRLSYESILLNIGKEQWLGPRCLIFTQTVNKLSYSSME